MTPALIKSLWTTPARWRGFRSEELWSLSLLTAVEHHRTVTVFTDQLGREWLRALKLPRAVKINTLLDDLHGCPGHVWALGKIYTNSVQARPFIQTDGDVMLGRPLPGRIMAASVCAERLYSGCPKWARNMALRAHWRAAIASKDGTAFNCGLFGGNDVEAIRCIAEAGIEFISRNIQSLHRIDGTTASIAAEEWMIAREYDPVEVTCLASRDPAAHLMLKTRGVYWHQAGESKRLRRCVTKTREELERRMPGQLARCRDVARNFRV